MICQDSDAHFQAQPIHTICDTGDCAINGMDEVAMEELCKGEITIAARNL